MVNFRFHIVSLVAVFLALALGIFLGSALGEPAIVNTLRNQIDRVSKRANDRNAENQQLRGETDRLRSVINQTAPFAVQDRLDGVDVVVIAEQGVSSARVHDTVNMLKAAGANASMTVWMQSRWQLTDAQDATMLADAIGSSSVDASVLRRVAFRDLALRFASAPEVTPTETATVAATAGESSTTTSTTTKANSTDVLQRLSNAKFVSIDGADVLSKFPIRKARALIIDGDKGDLADPALYDLLVTTFAQRGIETVAGEISSDSAADAPNRGDLVGAVRSDDALKGKVSTVDDLDLAQGRVAAVLALQQIADGMVGDYGYGKGASLVVPESAAQ